MSGARDPVARRLQRGRRLARLALGWEAFWPRLWPALGVAGAFAAAAWAGLFLVLPGWLHAALLALSAASLLAALIRPFRDFRWPGESAADRRIESASGLRHRPISTLRDHAVSADPDTLALWQAHQRRALAGLRRLRVGGPRPGMAARDPRALRAGLILTVFVALVMAGGEAGERLRRAFQPEFGTVAAAPAARLEAWVTPPSYTGAAPVFLDAAGGSLSVPQGSRLQLSLSGGTGGVPELGFDEMREPLRTLDAGSFTAERRLDHGARVVLRRDGRDLAAWNFSVQADQPPLAAFTEPPGRAPRGHATRLPWRTEDDWGVAGARAELRLAPRPGAAPLVVELPLSGGNRRQFRGVAQPDLSAHPWAGLPVRARIMARDGAGQEGASDSVELTLPERSFNHPVAQRLAGLRKSLSLDPLAREGARRELDDLSSRPDAFENDLATFLGLRVARFRLQRDRRPEAVEEAQALMWEMAVALEEGRTDRTAKALAAAREALREALSEAERTPPDAEGRAELERRVQELREAVQQHLEALAERLRQENAEPTAPEAGQRLMDQRELNRRTQEMEQAAREGRTDQLEQELAELEQMLDALQNGRVTARPEGGRNSSQRQQQQQRGQQQMSAVQDMVQREGQMLDRAHQRAEEQARHRAGEAGRPQQGQRQPPQRSSRDPAGGQQSQQGQPGQQAEQPSGGAQQDARQQRALRRALGELMQQFGDLTGEVPEALGRADQAMRRAEESLSRGGNATQHQQEAIRELQEGGRQMAQSMQRQFGQGEGQGEGEGDGEGGPGQAQGGSEGQDRARRQAQGRDPLGRPTRDSPGANDQGSDTRVPEEAERLRSRALQEELRRRGAERERPGVELDYIDRLLKSF
ncbi:TIGR02302 family protein [Pseudoroseomonas globiformis]|uniref:TIGR02302 family protein n=1 Tax=Teichococcus globiformis TaxID=2307229 RepID=A0ABV7FUG1_9PROT